MSFHEILARERKARGWSQEDLAAKIQVSRQAVSKWETGDAMPDLVKLLALADALELSLDALCGREAPAPAADTAALPAVRRAVPGGKARWAWLALCVLLAACMAAGGIWWNWSRRNIVPAEEALAESALPETLTVGAKGFFYHGGYLSYTFEPSIAGEEYAYQITFRDSSNQAHTFDAVYSSGVYSGTAALSDQDVYSVTVTVSSGEESRTKAIAVGLRFSEESSGWTPLD